MIAIDIPKPTASAVVVKCARDRYRMAETARGFGEVRCHGPSRARSRRDAPMSVSLSLIEVR